MGEAVSVHREIRGWLLRQPDWLQQAAEIVLSMGEVGDEDIRVLVERLKTEEGRRVTTHRVFEGLADEVPMAGDLRLLEIRDIHGIENLGPRRPLELGTANLCVIYGHNGSGKSGYTRLLKKACGKPRAAELKANVFGAAPSQRRCTIVYQTAGTRSEVEWPANGTPIADLRPTDIFDSAEAVAYLEGDTAASYTPRTVALFEALAAVCDRVRAQLQAEQENLVSALPTLPPEYRSTLTGLDYAALRPDMDPTALQRITEWSDADAQELARLVERLSATDPVALAREKRANMAQIDQLLSQMDRASSALGAERVREIGTLRDDVLAKRRMAAEAAKVTDAELGEIGSDTWRALWESARAFSQVVYPGRPFPVTEDAVCVLCHQDLGSAAKDRLRGFEAFVQGEMEAAAVAAERQYQQAVAAIPAVMRREEAIVLGRAAGMTDESLLVGLGDYWEQAGRIREALEKGDLGAAASGILRPSDLLEALNARRDLLGREAAQHEVDAAQFDRNQAGMDKLNLEARRWTAQQADAILAEVDRLRKRAAYEEWVQAASSRPVSRMASTVAEQVVTQAFADRFNRELRGLGAGRIQVELVKDRTERGQVLHRLRLRGASAERERPALILSEGERRIVGLAAFLADVADKPHAAPFVFDDPISSLDHDYEWLVAERLAKLARERQVLVMTHRLSLYGAMKEVAKDAEVDLRQHCIESFDGIAGHPVDQAAWQAKTKAANNILLDRLVEAVRVGEVNGSEAYRNLAQGICSDFRKLLERTVEEDLLNEIVLRHRRSVTTDNRMGNLPSITLDDCEFIDCLMGKYSCYVHSQSQEAPVFIPEGPELRQDLVALKEWRDGWRQRTR
jgi:energy-coupling factor transporter ATP-binding protein EcfA2